MLLGITFSNLSTEQKNLKAQKKINHVCRVLEPGHSANEALPSASWGTRQRLIFAECHRARTRQRPRTCPARAPAVLRPLGWLTALSLCRVSTTSSKFSVNLCRVPTAGTRQSFFCRVPGLQHSANVVNFFFALSIFFLFCT